MLKTIMSQRLRALTDMGIKPCGSSENEQAALWIMNTLSPTCPNIHLDTFTFYGWRNLGQSKLKLRTPHEQDLPTLAFLGSGGGTFQGRLKHVGLNHVWKIYSWDRYAVINDGKVTAWISGRPDGDLLSQTIVEEESTLPHLIVGQRENALLRDLLNHGETVEVEGFASCEHVKDMLGTNIVVHFPALKPEKKPILITAHRDTMYNTPGAYDNQAGTVVLMSLAEYLANADLKRDITISFTDAEECRLAGGVHLAQTYCRSDLDYMINVDGIGRGNELEIWSGPADFERLVMQVLLDDPTLPLQCYRNPPPPGSDHAPFYDRGIPCAMLTFNDQGIIHTPLDCYNNQLIPNMEKMYDAILKLIDLSAQEE